MSTEYKICDNDRVSLTAFEGSGRFDLDVLIEGVDFSLTIASDLTPEALLDIGLKLVQAALYNTGASHAENSKLLDEKIRALFV